jgi:hypothetical protein
MLGGDDMTALRQIKDCALLIIEDDGDDGENAENAEKVVEKYFLQRGFQVLKNR